MVGQILAIILVVLILIMLYVFINLSIIFTKDVIKNAIDISCYVNTYHYTKDLEDRLKIGQDKYYYSLFDKDRPFCRRKTDFIFEVFYTQIFNKLLNTIPVEVNRFNNRCLSDGEERKTEQKLDWYLKKQEEEYKKYASKNEIKSRQDCEACESK